MSIWPLTLSDLGWPWPWLILCTRVSYNQYMLKYGQKMSIWPLTLDDLGWPWPLTLTFGVGGHSHKPNGFCLESIRWIFIEIWPKRSIWPWPWVTLDDLDLWPWPSVVQVIHTNLMAFVWSRYDEYSLKYGQKGQFDLDLGWPWPLTLTIGGAGHSYKPNGFCLESIRSIFIEIWPKRSIWPWPWVTLDDLDLWPWPF